jgi:sialidase-1
MRKYFIVFFITLVSISAIGQEENPQIAKPEWKNDFKFITSGTGIFTRTGKMLHCLVNINRGLYVFGSNDHGKSWYFIDTPIKPADESKIVELADGSWMINSRVNGLGMRYVHVSMDEGKTWSEGKIIYPGSSAYSSLVILKNGDIGLFFEKEQHKENPFLSFSLKWLTDGNDKYKSPRN